MIGREAREQILAVEGRLPDAVVACVGGGSNAIGMFYDFVPDEDVRLIGVEAAGAASARHGPRQAFCTARARRCSPTTDGQIMDAHSISAGLDYPGVGPEHAFLRDTGRAEYVAVHRRRGARGVPPALRDGGDRPRARVVARTRARARPATPSSCVVCLSGRGDKDLAEVLAAPGSREQTSSSST